MTTAEQIRKALCDLESQTVDLQILPQAIIDAIDDGLPHNRADQLNKINCFTTCAMRNAALIEETRANLLTLAYAMEREGQE